MTMFDAFPQFLSQWFPLGLTLGIVVTLIWLIRYVLEKQFSTSTGFQFRNQVILLILSFFGFLAILFALPIQDTDRGQLLGFIGILGSAALALSATNFLGNILAGLMQRGVKNFRPGDFIQVRDIFGRVSEMGLFHVEIQTEDRDLTTVPNLFLVGNPVKVTRSSGTIVSAKVSLGYDVPYPLIKKQLISAGESAGLQDVYVHVKDLGDFSVTYRVAGLLKTVKNLLTTRSILREMMLDHLHEAGIEIVSPSFMNQRHLPETIQFIPEKSSPGTPSRKVPVPEEIVFDKAEEAKSIENLNDRQKDLSQRLEALKLELSDASQENDRRKLQNQIEHIEKLRVTLNEKIDLLKENVDRE